MRAGTGGRLASSDGLSFPVLIDREVRQGIRPPVLLAWNVQYTYRGENAQPAGRFRVKRPEVLRLHLVLSPQLPYEEFRVGVDGEGGDGVPRRLFERQEQRAVFRHVVRRLPEVAAEFRRRPPVPERGFSKDHRGDLLQLVDILTIASDGAVPMANRLADGSTEDSTTHEETWDQLVCMLGHSNFCYVADCKLATRDNMDHIAQRGGRFLTILPRTRKEDAAGRAWIARGGASWVEIARKPGKRKHDPDEVYWAAEAPSPSAEGYRIVWIRSSDKRARDAESRRQRIDRALCALRSLDEDLASARSGLESLAAVEDAAAVTIKEAGASRWARAKVTDTVSYEHRQEKRGRPGKSTRYRRIEHHRFSVASEVDQEAVAYDAASDGCFPFATNETLPPSELLRIYTFQPRLERRHAT